MTDMTNDPARPTMPVFLAAKLQERGLDPDSLPPAPDERTELAAEKAERSQARRRAWLERWERKVPVMYREAAIWHLDERQHGDAVMAWTQGAGLHLVLAGALGTGKTYAAYAVGNHMLELGRWVEAWQVGDLMDALRPGSTEGNAEERARRCDVLVLDDLTGKATDWEAERMTMLLDARVREERRTVVTTNITADQITAAWGGRLMDRLRFQLTGLTFAGESRRAGAW